MSGKFENLAFHVGPHKTGSTTLQDYVFPRLKNVQYLKNPGLVSVARVLSQSNGPVLVSSEDLSGVPFGLDYGARRVAMYKFIANSFPGSSIIIVLRKPSNVIASLYHQYLKMGGSRRFGEFIAERVDLSAFEYRDVINTLGVQPFSKVSVFFFEDLFVSGAPDLVFLHDKSWHYDGPRNAEESGSGWANRSLKRNGARALRMCNETAYRVGLGSLDWQPLWNKYWLRKFNLTPPKWLNLWPLRYFDLFGAEVTSEVSMMPEIRELDASYQALRDGWSRGQERMSGVYAPGTKVT